MLFLLVTSLLSVGLLNMVCLEDRVGIYYQDKIRAFYSAENILLSTEEKVIAGDNVSGAVIVEADICGVTFYRLTVASSYHGAQSILQSVIAKTGDFSSCIEKPKIIAGRQSFVIIK